MRPQLGVVVLCGANTLAISLADYYSKQQLATLSFQHTERILQAWTEVFPLGGAFFGCLLSWLPLRYLGRRATLQLVVAPLLAAGSCIMFAFHDMAMSTSSLVLVGVCLQGAALGVGFSATPIYILETCFPNTIEPHSYTRTASALIVSTQWSAAVGTMAGHLFPISPNTRYLHLVPATITAISSLGLCFVTETPRWLLLFRKNVEQAKASLNFLQGHDVPNYKICQVLVSFEKDEKKFCERRTNAAVIKLYLGALLLAMCLVSLPCLCGIHVYDFYSVWVFKFAGIFNKETNFSLAMLSAFIRVAAVGTATGILFMVDGVGFQCIFLIISTGTISIALGATSICLFGLEQGENWARVLPWLPLTIYLLFETVLWFGIGSHNFVTAFQFTPSPLRPSIISLAGGLGWLLEITVSKFLSFMMSTIHPFGAFLFYTGTSAAGLVLIVFVVVPGIIREKAAIEVLCDESVYQQDEFSSTQESPTEKLQTKELMCFPSTKFIEPARKISD